MKGILQSEILKIMHPEESISRRPIFSERNGNLIKIAANNPRILSRVCHMCNVFP